MKRTTFWGLAALLIVIAGSSYVLAFDMNSEVLGELQFHAPDSATDKKYLGISATGTFTLPQIGADVIIVEIFSMYCPICQAEAENVNKVHELIEANPDLKSRVRLIGIGIGNTPFEVGVFKKKYDIKFPLFPDDSFRIQKASSQRIRTPTFLAVEKKGSGTVAVSKMHIGGIDDVNAFVKEMIGRK